MRPPSVLAIAGLLAAALPALPITVATAAPAAQTHRVEWRTPDPSVDERPRAVVAEVGPRERARIISVTNSGDRPEIDVYPVRGEDEAARVVAREQARPDLLAVSVDGPVRLIEPQARDRGVTTDTYWQYQWALERLEVERLWAAGINGANGAYPWVVAVADSGIAVHEDIPVNVTTGPDYAPTDACSSAGSRDDQHGHGTHVAGTIAALTDNGTGIAGMAPSLQLLAVKVLDCRGAGSWAGVAKGILAAAEQAHVVNLSLGGDDGDPSLQVAIEYALSKGVVVVAAAGNARVDGSGIGYPAAYPGVVAVAASMPSDHYANFSNAGDSLDLTAPGYQILSTIPGNRYAAWNGTSMAAPHVSALAGMLRAEGAADPAAVMMATAQDRGRAGPDSDYGVGLIDPYLALMSVKMPSQTAPSAPRDVTATPGTGILTVSWAAPSAGDPPLRYSVTAGDRAAGCTATPPATTCTITDLDAGDYTAEVTARNAGGVSSAARATPVTVEGATDAAGDTYGTASPLTLASPTLEPLSRPNDLDYWRFTVPAREQVTVLLSDLPDGTDYDLKVFDDKDVYTDFQNDTTPEEVQVRNDSADAVTFTAVVYGYSGYSANKPYTLRADTAPVSVPPAPGTPTATAGDREVGLSWTQSDATPVTGFRIQERVGDSGDWTTVVEDSGNAATEATVGDRSNGTTYRYRVAAINALGVGEYSEASESVRPRTTPAAPQGVTATALDQSVQLTWTAPASDGGEAVTGYVVQSLTRAGDWQAVAEGAATSHTLSGLVNGEQSRFRVLARNSAGLGTASAVVTATPLSVPGRPDITAVDVTRKGDVELRWRWPDNGGATITRYRVQHRKVGDENWKKDKAPGDAKRTVIRDLRRGRAYVFRIAAVNQKGAGRWSLRTAPVTVAAVPGRPQRPVVTVTGGGTRVTWDAPSFNGGAVITAYRVQRRVDGEWRRVDTVSGRSYTTRKATTNRYRVAAVNAVGAGRFSRPSQ